MYRLKTMAAAVAATALIATGTGFALPAAVAQGTGTSETAVAPAAIPAEGNLTIHKVIGQANKDVRSDGTEKEVTGTPGNGINFTVTRLGTDANTPINLTTQDGWKAISGKEMSGTALPDGLAKTKDVKTGATKNGVVSFADLAAGIYLVEEPANQVTTEGQAVVGSAPFLVTVPMTDPNGTGWLGNVHVYPKNQVVQQPKKEVTEIDGTQPGITVGENIAYTIQAPIPTASNAAGDKVLPASFTVTDKLPAGLGAATNIKVSLDGTELTSQQYSVIPGTVGDQNTVRIVVKPSKETDKTDGVTLTVYLEAPVNSLDGALNNTAWSVPEDLSSADPTWDPENPGEGSKPGTSTGKEKAKATFADITITKKKAGAEDKLAGAKFQLYRCEAGAKIGNPIKVNKANTWETGADGTVKISGLSLTTANTAGEITNPWDAQGDSFCLVESQAPKGYALLSKPVVLDSINDTVLTTTSQDENVQVTPTIENAADEGILSRLPLTGGMGIWFILAAGLAMIIAGLAYSRKRA